MFRAQSWIRRSGMAVVVLASLCAGTVALPHAEGLDDFACSPVPVSHDERAHSIGAASTSRESDGQHCFLCHSLRSFHTPLERSPQRHRAVRAERLHATPFALAERLDWPLAPGRAPPV
jgi:hypothetical protein